MSRQYKREYRLTIGDGTSALIITDLKVVFRITKDLIGYPNSAEIDVYNLSKESQSKIENEFINISLNIGYENNIKLVFKGEIKNVQHVKQGVDLVSTIFAGDGQQDFDTSFSSFTLSEGATVEDIIKQVASGFEKATLGVIEGLSNKDKLLGFSVSKPSKDAMDDLAREYNFDWSIQDGQINIIDKDAFVNREFKISQATGMIGSPTITEIGADVTFLINPEILPGRIINVESVGADIAIGNLIFRNLPRTKGTGRYKILKITYSGGPRETDWTSTAVGKIIL